MSHSLNRVLVHIVFATKFRQPLIDDSVRDDLHAYMGGILHRNKGELLAAGSMPEHIHLLVVLPKHLTLSKLLFHLKRSSSLWIKTQGTKYASFHWQSGYFAGSVSDRNRGVVERYILRQKEIHERRKFEEEYISLIREGGLEVPVPFYWD